MATQIHGGKHYYDPAKAALSAFNMSLLPVLYFFSFLYYTDVGSTLMVLLAYCLHLDGRDVLLNILISINPITSYILEWKPVKGIVAVLARQICKIC